MLAIALYTLAWGAPPFSVGYPIHPVGRFVSRYPEKEGNFEVPPTLEELNKPSFYEWDTSLGKHLDGFTLWVLDDFGQPTTVLNDNIVLTGRDLDDGDYHLVVTLLDAPELYDLLDLDAPVHAGANRPLVQPARHAGYVHGVSGMDGADLPEPSRPAESHDAVGFIIETCRAHEGVWLVPTGPLTNIALALRAAPDLAARIAGISVMGGGTFGNRTAAAEFNLWADPEAADMVFSYGGPLIMSGLDVTHRFQALPHRIDMVRALPGRLAAVLADLLDFFSETYRSRHHHITGAAVHDPCAVMALTHPFLFRREFRHVEIETHGLRTAGMTIIDQRDLKEVPDANCDVQVDVDADAAWDVVVEAIAHFSR